MKKPKLIGVVILVILLVIMVIQNTEDVNTKLLFWERSMPQSILLFVTFLLGAGVGLLMSRKILGPRQ